MVSRAVIGTEFNAIRSDELRLAVRQIENQTGRQVYVKPKGLRKFGTHDNVSATELETVWEVNGNEVYISDNLINRAVSSSALDTQLIEMEGHTIDGDGNKTFVPGQFVTLNGQTPVAFTTPLARHTRAINRGSTELAGDVYFYQSTSTVTNGVPDNLDLVHNKISGTASPSQNQSQKASTSISQHDWWAIKTWSASVRVKQDTRCNFYLEVRDKGGVFRVVSTLACSAGDTRDRKYEPLLIVNPNSDVRIRVIGAAAGAEVSSEINGYLITDPASAGAFS